MQRIQRSRTDSYQNRLKLNIIENFQYNAEDKTWFTQCAWTNVQKSAIHFSKNLLRKLSDTFVVVHKELWVEDNSLVDRQPGFHNLVVHRHPLRTVVEVLAKPDPFSEANKNVIQERVLAWETVE